MAVAVAVDDWMAFLIHWSKRYNIGNQMRVITDVS
jgi:hypothetical protein